jgi:ankyrin repeat protein
MAAHSQNPFLLAADNSPALIPLLESNPSLSSSQDNHGYSLVHAATSYGHIDLLRKLIKDFKVPVDLLDEDQESALFQVETVAVAKVLVEELGANINIKNEDGQTAAEKIEEEGDYVLVAAYLRDVDASRSDSTAGKETSGREPSRISTEDLNLPENMKVSFISADEAAIGDLPPVDDDFRKKIEELAQRGDFDQEAGQQELRRLVEDAVKGKLMNENGTLDDTGADDATRRRLQ